MYVPPPHDSDRPPFERPTWTRVATAYLLAAAIPLLLWASAHPIQTAGLIGSVGGLRVAWRRVRDRIDRLLDRRRVTVQIGESVTVTVTNRHGSGSTPATHCCPA